ncbi:hypothetical protein BDR06DRAFT_916785, partial [Suillus hirtellus]
KLILHHDADCHQVIQHRCFRPQPHLPKVWRIVLLISYWHHYRQVFHNTNLRRYITPISHHHPSTRKQR